MARSGTESGLKDLQTVARNGIRAQGLANSCTNDRLREQVTENPTCDHDDVPPPPPVCSAEVLERAAAILRAAGEPGRLRLLERLAPGERCVTELADLSGDSLPTVSARLRVLRGERLLSRRREGKHQFYALADRHVAELVQGVLEHAAEEDS